MNCIWGYPCSFCMHNRDIINQIQIFSKGWNIALFPCILKYEAVGTCNNSICTWVKFKFNVKSIWTNVPQWFGTCNGYPTCELDLTDISINGLAFCESGIVSVQILNYISYYPHPCMDTLHSVAIFLLINFLTFDSTKVIADIVIIFFCTITILIIIIRSILLEHLNSTLLLIILFL